MADVLSLCEGSFILLPFLAIFVIWLALKGRLGAYAGFVTSGPGFSLGSIAAPSSSNAAGSSGVAGSAYLNPALYPSTVARAQNQVQGGKTAFPLSQSAPSSGQRANMWPFS